MTFYFYKRPDFQLPLLREYFSSHVSYGKLVDDDNPLPPIQKPRGYGGVACLVRKDFDLSFKFHLNGRNRVLLLEALSEPPLCIVGVYMPVPCTSKKQDFQEVLDEIAEIIQILSHVVFLVGDMNSFVMTRCGNERDKLGNISFLNNLLHGQCGAVTYIHSDTSCSSEIDYIFYSKKGSKLLSGVNVLSDHLNVSDHLPVVANVKVEKTNLNEECKLFDIKPKWDKCKSVKYKGTINRFLGPFPGDEETGLDFLCAIGHMTSVLKKSDSMAYTRA